MFSRVDVEEEETHQLNQFNPIRNVSLFSLIYKVMFCHVFMFRKIKYFLSFFIELFEFFFLLLDQVATFLLYTAL